MFQKILVGVDGSAASFRALAMAVGVARPFAASVHVILVEEVPPRSGTIEDVRLRKAQEDHLLAGHRRRIDEIIAELGAPRPSVHVFTGHPVQTIVEFARDNAFDLLAIGATGRSDVYERLLGGRASRIVHLAPCAVLVVK